MSSEKNYINDQHKSFFEDGLSKTDPDLYKAINLIKIFLSTKFEGGRHLRRVKKI